MQLANGTEKNNATCRRYKRMVRCLKKMQSRLVQAGTLEKELPSYLVECIVYNVPNWAFNHTTYLEDFRSVVGYVWAETRSGGNWNDWHEVHELHYLFRGSPPWTAHQVHDLADKAWDEVGVK